MVVHVRVDGYRMWAEDRELIVWTKELIDSKVIHIDLSPPLVVNEFLVCELFSK